MFTNEFTMKYWPSAPLTHTGPSHSPGKDPGNMFSEHLQHLRLVTAPKKLKMPQTLIAHKWKERKVPPNLTALKIYMAFSIASWEAKTFLTNPWKNKKHILINHAGRIHELSCYSFQRKRHSTITVTWNEQRLRSPKNVGEKSNADRHTRQLTHNIRLCICLFCMLGCLGCQHFHILLSVFSFIIWHNCCTVTPNFIICNFTFLSKDPHPQTK